MILTDREIQLAIANKQITVSPEPKADAFSSTSLDLALDEPGEEWALLKGQPIRPGAVGYSYSQLAGRKKKVSLSGYNLGPRAFVLAWTKETIGLPGAVRTRTDDPLD